MTYLPPATALSSSTMEREASPLWATSRKRRYKNGLPNSVEPAQPGHVAHFLLCGPWFSVTLDEAPAKPNLLGCMSRLVAQSDKSPTWSLYPFERLD